MVVDKGLVVPQSVDGHHSDHSVEMPSDPERKTVVNTKTGTVWFTSAMFYIAYTVVL